jgi:hypothetical protein
MLQGQAQNEGRTGGPDLEDRGSDPERLLEPPQEPDERAFRAPTLPVQNWTGHAAPTAFAIRAERKVSAEMTGRPYAMTSRES